MSEIEKLEPIFRLASLGWKIYPVSRSDYKGIGAGKSPWCANGFHDATSNVKAILAWAEEKSGCNWGYLPCDGRLVLDADQKHGGIEALALLEAKHGPLPATPCVLTGGGGRHYHFSCHIGFQAKKKIAGCEGLEIIAAKGGVIIPPSIHADSGRAYQWLTLPWQMPLAPAPDWLLELAGDAATHSEAVSKRLDLDTLDCGSGVGTDFATLGAVPQGERNAVLCEAIGRHVGRGESEEQVLEQALAWARANGYDEAEMRRKVRSIARKNEAKQQPPLSPGERIRVSITEDRSDTLVLASELTTSASAGSDLVSSLALHPDAYCGIFGEIVRAVEPETEADPAGVLVCLLCAFGSCLGRSPCFKVGKGIHHTNLFAVLVGKTTASKGDAWDIAFDLVSRADADWANKCVAYGMGSGEGLVDRVRDAVTERREARGENGTVTGWETLTLEAASEDKRLLCVEEEFVKPLALMRREDSTLSAHVRNAWSGKPLEVLNRRKNRIKATDTHISILGHITPEELLKTLGGSVETKNGFLNRFLLCVVKRSKLLPDGGDGNTLDRFIDPLKGIVAKAKGIAEMIRSEEAGRLWREVYQGLAESDAVGTERARPQALRLSMLYALADGSDTVEVKHLRAALAVWRYCEASARLLFEDNNKSHPPTREPLWVRLLKVIDRSPGTNRKQLHERFGNHLTANEMSGALEYLESQGSAHRRPVVNGGRPAECWFPGPKPPGPGGGEPSEQSEQCLSDPVEAEGEVSACEQSEQSELSLSDTEARGDLVRSLAGLEQEKCEQSRGGEGFVVPQGPTHNAFVCDPEGGFRASGEPERPDWPPPSYAGVRRREDGMLDLLPAFHHLPAPPKRQPHPEDDPTIPEDFLSGLDADKELADTPLINSVGFG